MAIVRSVRVGEFELDFDTRSLRRGRERIALQPRGFDLLVYLVDHRDRVVTKSELLEKVWSGEAVVKDVLTTALHGLRRALGDDPKRPRFIRTVHRVGYQLVAPVTVARRSPALEARHAAFVGRREQKRLFTQMLDGESAVQLLFVHGPPGIGKTRLLQELSYQCLSRDVERVWLSAERAGPFLEGFVRALATELSCEPSLDGIRSRLVSRPVVVFVDDVHLLGAADEWLREELWPALPATARLVLAGRRAPSQRWRFDQAWRPTACEVNLGALTVEDVEKLLVARGRDPGEASTLWKATSGHALAVVLALDTIREAEQDDVFSTRDVLSALAERFIDQIADEKRLRAFEAACMLEDASERVLAVLDDPARAAASFAWLSSLSFVETRADTVRVHPLVRDAVVARLAARDPSRVARLLEDVYRFFRDELARARDPETKLRSLEMVMDVGRFHPALRANHLASDAGPECTVQPATGREIALVPDAVRAYEGDESAKIAQHWLAHPNTSVWSVRDGSEVPAGFLVMTRIRADERDASARDPMTRAILDYLREEGRARKDEEIVIHRFLVARDDHQAPSVVTKLLHTVKISFLFWYGTHAPDVAHVFSVYAQPDVWEPAANSAAFVRLRGREVAIGGRTYTPFHLCVRDLPIEAWFERLTSGLIRAVRGGAG